MIVYASAKINLCLDVLKKNLDGYHEIQTILQEVPKLQNKIEISKTKQPTHMSRPNSLAEKAIHLLKENYKIDKFVDLKITRNIPPGSGLGGESSNAAAILKALNSLWNLNLQQPELLALASQIGMDVPFFIVGGTALGTHYGEIITPLQPILDLNPQVHINSDPTLNKTQNAYLNLDLTMCGKNVDKTEELIQQLRSPQIPTCKVYHSGALHNDFETLPQYQELRSPTITTCKSADPGAQYHLSGSGPSTFTL